MKDSILSDNIYEITESFDTRNLIGNANNKSSYKTMLTSKDDFNNLNWRHKCRMLSEQYLSVIKAMKLEISNLKQELVN